MRDQSIRSIDSEASTVDERARWSAVSVLCAGMLMIVLDSTIVNVALPSIQADLHFTPSELAWVVNAYLIPFGGLLLLAGRIGDLVGQRRVFLIGLAMFTAASVVCALANSPGMLVFGRFLQGIGGALSSAVILGMIVRILPERSDQAKAIGIYTFVAVAGGSIGLLAGGLLTEVLNWHWIFIVNVPIGLPTALLTLRLVDDLPGIGWSRGADIVGAALLTAGLMTGVYAILGVHEQGWTSQQTLTLGAVAIALEAGFVIRQSRVATPLMPLGVLTSRTVAGANLMQALAVAGPFGMFFLGALYLQGLVDYSPLDVGLAFLPWTIAMGALALRPTTWLMERFGPQTTLVAGLALIAVGLALFVRSPLDANYVLDVLPTVTLAGAGAGLVFPSLTTLAMSGATPSDSGLASGLVNTSLQVGGALGLAILATLASNHTAGLLMDGEPAAQALNAGYHRAYLVGAAFTAVALVLAVCMAARRPTPDQPPPGPSQARARP